MPGSTQAFIAFHAAMLTKDRMAVCSFVRTKAAEPRLVALLPQVEEVDDHGVQVGEEKHRKSIRKKTYTIRRHNGSL